MRRACPGLSLVELLVAIAVLSILSAMSYATYRTLSERKALDTDTQELVAELGEARSLTLSAKNGDQWGVHVATTSVALFEGGAYSSSGSNVTTQLTAGASVSNIALAGGGTDVVFQKLTGKTSQSGTVTLSLDASSSVSKTVVIYATGIAQVQ